MLGRVPVNPSYVRCHGGIFGCTLPLVQDSSLARALVIAPIRDLATLGIVPAWKEPSRVTWHLMVNMPKVEVNSSLLHVALMFWLLVERFLADALPTATQSSSAVVRAVRPSFLETRMR